jgi:hypothetical protein
MANEMFTTRSGKQVPLPTVVIPATEVVSLLRLQEDFIRRGEHLSMLGVLLDVLDKGRRQVRNQWKNGDLSKSRRDFAKAVAPYMVNPAKYAADIAQLARQYGLVNGTTVDLSDPEPEPEEEVIDAEIVDLTPTPDGLTEEQLEQATAPSEGAH